ncbi:hypothetical protein F7725_003526 [Dissostichus mawsoni]|uniref:Uncharacterized protein n=1 Tax=Dissostichus mawsoni TaxID=36200 RepID=A0A7J5YDT6_DISMA|nr:hypothetical protein F7725_003526 [Dissostichus mawsoni]
MLISARLFVEVELEELSRSVLRLLRLTSGRLRPKRAMPALGELSICLEETSMDISVRRDEAVSGLRPPDSSMRLMPVFGERGLRGRIGERSIQCYGSSGRSSAGWMWRRRMSGEDWCSDESGRRLFSKTFFSSQGRLHVSCEADTTRLFLAQSME